MGPAHPGSSKEMEPTPNSSEEIPTIPCRDQTSAALRKFSTAGRSERQDIPSGKSRCPLLPWKGRFSGRSKC